MLLLNVISGGRKTFLQDVTIINETMKVGEASSRRVQKSRLANSSSTQKNTSGQSTEKKLKTPLTRFSYIHSCNALAQHKNNANTRSVNLSERAEPRFPTHPLEYKMISRERTKFQTRS